MSYILDALKKSEQERSLGEAPGLDSEHRLLHQYKSNHLNVYVLLAFAGFVLLLAGFGFYFYQLNQNTQAELANTQASMQAMQKQTTPLPEQQKPDEKPVKAPDLVDEIEHAEIIRPSKERQQALQDKIKTEDKTDRQVKEKYQNYFDAQEKALQKQVPEADKTLKTEEAIEEDEEQTSEETVNETHNEYEAPEQDWRSISTIYELSPDIRARIPKLEVTTHIYSSAAAYRRATINDKTAKEGSLIETGLILETITEDGVVFSLEGQRFRMNAIDKWPN